MKKYSFLWVLVLALFSFFLTSCNHKLTVEEAEAAVVQGENDNKQNDVHVLDIVSNAVWGENHAYSERNGKTWEVSGDAQSFYALYAPVSVSEFDSMKAVISADFGDPTYTNLTLPAELIPSADTGTFWMAWKSHNRFCYWCNDTINIGWGLFEEELLNDTGYAYLYIENK